MAQKPFRVTHGVPGTPPERGPGPSGCEDNRCRRSRDSSLLLVTSFLCCQGRHDPSQLPVTTFPCCQGHWDPSLPPASGFLCCEGRWGLFQPLVASFLFPEATVMGKSGSAIARSLNELVGNPGGKAGWTWSTLKACTRSTTHGPKALQSHTWCTWYTP